MLSNKTTISRIGLALLLSTTLGLAGCSDSDKKGIFIPNDPAVGSGEIFHGAEWATIKNLDPRGEQCVECHGENADMSPYRNGAMAHNIGLQKNTDHSAYSDLKITGVKIDESNGKVTVTLNKAIPDNAGALSMTFAKLAPRVIHNRGHDWQNYFASNAYGFGENRLVEAQGKEAMMLQNGGVQPQTVPNPQVNGKTITFNLGDGEGRSWGKHDFTVKSAYKDDTETWEYKGIRGTKFFDKDKNWGISEHSTCDIANKDANQINSKTTYTYDEKNNQGQVTATHSSKAPVCWWPDGTHLTSGVFVSDENEFIVAYEPDYTHRVTVIIGGQPGFNTWYDFVPSVANGTKKVVKNSDKTGDDTKELVLPDNAPAYIKADGSIDASLYEVAAGTNAAFGAGVPEHQNLPAARDVVDVQSCNSCHDSLSMHGGARSQTQTCVTCHNPGNLQAASGRSVDFKQLIHRIHRGENLPSEDKDIAALMGEPDSDKPAQSGSLVATHAGDFTKVRFPQGPTPGEAAGITNCVKCHMGEQTKAMLQGLADELGAKHFDVQSEMKLAKITPQGDNWLTVRSVNACQACHDSNVWFSESASRKNNGVNIAREDGNVNLDNNIDKIAKYIPFYTDSYSGVGFNWLGKKLGRTNDAGWIHTTGSPGIDDRFSCGSSGGCHSNTALDSGLTLGSNGRPDTPHLLNPDAWPEVGDRKSNNIHRVHLELTRNYILAERFETVISDESFDAETGKFTAKAQIIDKRTNSSISVAPDLDDDGNQKKDNRGNLLWVTAAAPDKLDSTLSVGASGQLGWMINSPDYNHSAGTGIPGSPAGVAVAWDGDTATLSADLSDLGQRGDKELAALKANLDQSVGTVFVQVSLGDYRPKTVVQDFRFNGKSLDANDGRRVVVDFEAGQGNDANRDRYAGWDKEHGSNTQSCSSCHLQLAYHGSRTNNVQACVVCHNAQRTDLSSRGRNADSNKMLVKGGDGQYEESLDFKRLIHTIHSASSMRIDPMYVNNSGNTRPSIEGDEVRGHSFPGVLSNCKSCHIQDEDTGKWTFELDQLPEGMIGSTAITGDWAKEAYNAAGSQHDFDNHMKMSPIASVCSSCHDAGYKTSDGRMNHDIRDGGPYVGSHWWVMGGIAPGIVPDNGTKPSETKHQSGAKL